jgi:threonine synthase
MGLDAHFLAATNANDEVPELLRTGTFTPGPSRPTLSTAMDVGNPSNLDRILHLYGGSLDRLREDLVAASVSDGETRSTIRRVHQERGYILDPHSAVGYAALEAELARRPDDVGILLATAHPAKFAEVVEPILGKPLPLPPELASCMEAQRQVTPLEPELDGLKRILLGEA